MSSLINSTCPAYHPATMLKLFIYGYLNRVHSSRRLEREAQRTVELMWLTGRLAPDFKTIADFRKDNGTAIRLVCRKFVILCRNLNLFANAFVAIDGSKFKAVNNRDRNYTRAKMKRRIAEVDATNERDLPQRAEADRQEPVEDKTPRQQISLAGSSTRIRTTRTSRSHTRRSIEASSFRPVGP
jgi:transposase